MSKSTKIIVNGDLSFSIFKKFLNSQGTTPLKFFKIYFNSLISKSFSKLIFKVEKTKEIDLSRYPKLNFAYELFKKSFIENEINNPDLKLDQLSKSEYDEIIKKLYKGKKE